MNRPLTYYHARIVDTDTTAGAALELECPCGCGHTMLLAFSNPIQEGGEPLKAATSLFTRVGDTVDYISLLETIMRESCGWRGFIEFGEVITLP